MCFSASASFTASAFLIPTGIYCVIEAKKRNETYLPLASLPLFFGIQQGFEGFVWLNIVSENTIAVTNFALGFLFFSHFFWLFWIPFSAFSLEKKASLKNVLKYFTILGFFYGTLLYFPLIVNNDWLQIKVINHSIEYLTYFLFNPIAPHNFSFYFYALIILLPLIITSTKTLNFLGILLILAASITYFGFHYAFISVWCFMAAVVSLYLINTIANVPELTHQNIVKH